MSGDWREEAACVVDDPFDLQFIIEPDEVSSRRWAKTCSKCAVLEQCFNWACDNAIGVFAAGEWWPDIEEKELADEQLG